MYHIALFRRVRKGVYEKNKNKNYFIPKRFTLLCVLYISAKNIELGTAHIIRAHSRV